MWRGHITVRMCAQFGIHHVTEPQLLYLQLKLPASIMCVIFIRLPNFSNFPHEACICMPVPWPPVKRHCSMMPPFSFFCHLKAAVASCIKYTFDIWYWFCRLPWSWLAGCTVCSAAVSSACAHWCGYIIPSANDCISLSMCAQALLYDVQSSEMSDLHLSILFYMCTSTDYINFHATLRRTIILILIHWPYHEMRSRGPPIVWSWCNLGQSTAAFV